MIKHIVMFRIDKHDSSVEKQTKIQTLKNKLEALPEIIPEIKFFETGINISNSPAAYDLVLVSEFESLDTLKTYSTHPEHLKVVEYVNKVTSERKVVDYKI